MFTRKKILITGATGFIGRNVAEYLSSKHDVIAPAHKELELLDEDAVAKFFCEQNIDIVIHCAVRPGHRNAKDPSNQLYNNLRMFFNIARNLRRFDKMIFLSSGAAYDVSRPLVKVKEEDSNACIPADEHGFSKYIIAKHIEGSDGIIELRIFGIFGKHEDYSIRFISNAICKAIFDLPITIKQNRKFDYIYIDDLMPVLDYFICHKAGHKVYNVTPDVSFELLALAEKIKKVSGKDLPIVVNDKTMGVEYSGDNSRLKKEMGGWQPVPIESAIEKLYRWYYDNKSSLNKELLLMDK